MANLDTGDSPNKFGKQEDWDEYSTEELRVGLSRITPLVLAARSKGVAAPQADSKPAGQVDE